jgi:branched-chain amino acid transport system substrate-binding protein
MKEGPMTAVSASGEHGSAGSGPRAASVGPNRAGAIPDGPSDGLVARSVSRRGFLRAAGLAAAAVPASAALAACGGGSGGSTANRAVRVGFVTPQTGSLNGFADADIYTINAMRTIFAKGIMVGNQSHPLEIVYRDSQSDPNQAASAASDLIFKDNVDIMLVGATSDTTNPVADQCEANQVPCISTAAPWENWFNGRGGKLGHNYTWTFHVFWGLDDLAGVYSDMWQAQTTNRKIGLLMPNDTDGDQFARSLPNIIQSHGYTVPQGMSFRYNDRSSSVASIPARMAAAGVEILVGVPLAEDFSKFWKAGSAADTAGNSQVFRPKIVTLSRALLFPGDVLNLLGSAGDRLGTEIWWTPSHPYASSLTGATPKQLAADYTSKSGKEWVQPLGFSHALFEVVNKALASVSSIDDRASIAKAIGNVRNLNTIVGPLAFGNGSGSTTTLPANVAKTPLVGGQWRSNNSAGANPYDLYITSNSQHADIKLTRQFQALA